MLNNPLNYTDPSGFFFKKIFKSVFKAIGSVFKTVLNNKVLRTIAAVAIVAIPGGQGLGIMMMKGFAAGFIGSGGDFRAGIVGAITAGAFHFVGHSEFAGNLYKSAGQFKHAVKTTAHGLVGGMSSTLSGGKFNHGFLSAGFNQQFGGFSERYANPVAKITSAAATGGVSSVLGGGKFANGATTYGYMRLSMEIPSYYRRYVGYDLDIRPGGEAVEKGRIGMPVARANNVGTQSFWRFDSNGQRLIGFFEEGGPVSRVANQIPGINAVAGMHDKFQISMGNSFMRDILNVPGMAVAAGITYPGFVGQALNNAPANAYIPIGAGNSKDKEQLRWVPAAGF